MSRQPSEDCCPLLILSRESHEPLQNQVVSRLVELIADGYFAYQNRLPSSRVLAAQLSVSRTTIIGAYSKLIDQGMLAGHERSGYYVRAVAPDSVFAYAPIEPIKIRRSHNHILWSGRFQATPSNKINVSKPSNWYQYRYPFIYGQPDKKIFPWREWRKCVNDAHVVTLDSTWMFDNSLEEGSQLGDYIVQKILPRRGIYIHKDELLITLGAQQALYLIGSLFFGEGVKVGIEDPGYADARNIFSLFHAETLPLPVDENGIRIPPSIKNLDFVYVTPSHQVPTGATLSDRRRHQLLRAAKSSNLVLIEDDYDSEINYLSPRSPALRASEPERVIYIGSLSKTLFPSLRLGYVVAPRPCIRELRALQRLMIRQPPTSALITAGFFMQRGYYDSYLCMLHDHLKRKCVASSWKCNSK